MKKIAIILSGCGVYDGSEIHEAVLTMLAITQQGGEYRCFAPNINQHHVVNHLTGNIEEGETRNVLVESARIARGDIEDINELVVTDFDALVLPGGFGAAKNLCDFAIKGESCMMQSDVLRVFQAFAQANKPAGYICIAPAMIALVYGQGSQGTIGTDRDIAAQLTSMGLKHISCPVDEIVMDEKNKVISTPAYMLAGNIGEAAQGINKLIEKLLAMA
ncbi:MAG: isoprenoid biosynthesis glyoxalase ElbB [Alteromonadaceae bacterium]|nr:isoprenoid biosynthesis glyoxalase ElbB [Alteromonadaceae bacterium]